MMGWAMLVGIALAAAALLWLVRFPRAMWTLPAAALMLGAAGYAWQGRPTLGGRPVSTEPVRGETDAELVALRDAMFGRFDFRYSYFVASDAMMRAGKPDHAVGVLIGGVGKSPQDGGLWTMLGLALAEHDGNIVSPPAQLAFDRALALMPDHPGPPFFLGLAQIRANEFEKARENWARAVELTPEKASYRQALAVRLALLDQLLAARAAEASAAVGRARIPAEAPQAAPAPQQAAPASTEPTP